MKILQIIDSLNVGGAEVLAVNIANELSEDGVESHLCVTRKEGELKSSVNKKVNYLFLEKTTTLDFKAIFKLKNYIKRHSIKVIHAHTTSSFIAICVKLLYPSVKIIWHNHTGAYINLKGKKLLALKLYSKHISYIISVTKELDIWSKRVLKHYNGSYMPNFVTFSNKNKVTTLKGVLGKRIICLAGLREVKDHLNLIKAFELVKKDFPDWSLHLVGKDYMDDYSITIKQYIKERLLTDSVYIYNAQLDVKNILSQASIGVLSSKSEGLPLALLEYGLANLPVIVTNVGECNSIVDNESLIKPENFKLFAKGLLEIIKNNDLRNKLAFNLNKTVTENFTHEVYLKRLKTIYKY